jgi:hypothetical protein
MLIYHFGAKDQLVTEVLRAAGCEDRQRANAAFDALA